MVCELTPQEVRSKELGRITMLEGTKLWKTQKDAQFRRELQEKREVRELLENYWPWGRPGGGAPNSRNVGLRNVYLEEMYPNEDILKAKRQVGTFQFGRPGGGAPQINRAGKKQTRFREDPALRFQWGNDLRRTVDNALRYRVKQEEKQQYKKQLDAQVEQKKRAQESELQRKIDFERKMGWTSDATAQRIKLENCQPDLQDLPDRRHHHKHHHHGNRHSHDNSEQGQNRKLLSNDIELVPLIVRRRPSVKPFLGTTDVTRGDAMSNRVVVAEPKYFRDLSQQVHQKHQRMKDARLEDIKGCQEHFKTWSHLWGRPGHGAPRSATQKGHLMSMLYPQMQPMPVH